MLAFGRVVVEVVPERIGHLIFRDAAYELHDDTLRRLGLQDGAGVRRLLLKIKPGDIELDPVLRSDPHAVEHSGVPLA